MKYFLMVIFYCKKKIFSPNEMRVANMIFLCNSCFQMKKNKFACL